MANHRMTKPKRFTAFPVGQLGWWGLGLTFTFTLVFAIKASNLPIPMPVPSFAIFGIGLVGLGLNLGAFFRGDRSWVLLIFGGLIGAFILVWIFGEFAFPH